MVDEAGDIVKVRKRTFGGKKSGYWPGRVGRIKETSYRRALVDFSDFDTEQPQQRVYQKTELQSVQEAKDMPSHIRRAEREA